MDLSFPIVSLRISSASTMENYLIDLSRNQALRGNKVGHGLVAEAWTEIVKLFNWTLVSL